MRFLTKSGWIVVVRTDGPRWVLPMRLAVGVLLLFPVGSGVQQLFTFYDVDKSGLSFGVTAVGILLRAIEILAGMAFVAGLAIRLTGYPAVIIFVVRALANSANSFAWLRDIVNDLIVPHGDWGFGAMYLAAALFTSELLVVGSGRWSVDYWLSKKLAAIGKPNSRP
ncbi:DoxX family protein [Paraburkholderia fungorum]|uniref:Membrane protein YphA (DoxX/SURF4 family) n=1 Tax=Paraburkholderia fungorum TaxID=134537 RepID=A0AAW3V343_9BURK|nr:hypothetical protein [Paraburkholderia fungorum]AJZ56282.1 TQO small subunit DoxD family protein [Paraburkholderia fungorum]MBB4516594.1 putative membrane protein YphA (DoxX/SURF4 family) [Paraburkholderia fungorum]MBB5545148.1 putative membrane protein YphA (DoxX/SURF4 family) [Paraburkholderia fungorum]MBB6204933.1 putative membrane protein YphA (DoxX/SURF4 family) [Paraburkholderia fungorum]MDE1010471.1 hypothetical protein [Paraburkholderia fungorum]